VASFDWLDSPKFAFFGRHYLISYTVFKFIFRWFHTWARMSTRKRCPFHTRAKPVRDRPAGFTLGAELVRERAASFTLGAMDLYTRCSLQPELHLHAAAWRKLLMRRTTHGTKKIPLLLLLMMIMLLRPWISETLLQNLRSNCQASLCHHTGCWSCVFYLEICRRDWTLSSSVLEKKKKKNLKSI
jgi:hypothetical protein